MNDRPPPPANAPKPDDELAAILDNPLFSDNDNDFCGFEYRASW